MRAVLSATVSWVSSDSGSGLSGRRGLPTRSQIRDALAAKGLTPPPLVKYRTRSPEVQSESEVSEVALFRELARVVGSVAKERETLTPDDLLITDSAILDTDADAAGKHLSESLDVAASHAIQGLSRYALPVLTRMPTRSIEDRDKRRSAADNLLFTSSLDPTRTLFVVSQENEGAVTFRLHHQLVERLQRGTEDMFKRLSGPIELEGGTVEFLFQSPIEIYEVGQEDATILGEVVGTSTASRIRYALARDRVSYLVFAILAAVFLGLFLTLLVQHIAHSTVFLAIVGPHNAERVSESDGFWLGQGQRLQSAVVPVLLVTGVTLLVKFPRGTVIKWNQRYGSDR